MSTFAKHLAAVKSGTVTRSNVTGIKKAINAFERKSAGYHNGVTSPEWSLAEMREMQAAIEEHKPRAVGKLHETGAYVLRNPRYSARWSDFQRSIIDRLSRFELVGFVPAGRWTVCPVFRAVSDFGAAFEFYNIPWQTAYAEGLESGPQIVGRK